MAWNVIGEDGRPDVHKSQADFMPSHTGTGRPCGGFYGADMTSAQGLAQLKRQAITLVETTLLLGRVRRSVAHNFAGGQITTSKDGFCDKVRR